MNKRRVGLMFVIASVAAIAGADSSSKVQAGQTPAAQESERAEAFVSKVKPVLDANCGRCHEGLNRRGGLSMETRESLLKGGHHGAAIVPGDAANSLMIRLIRHAGPSDDPMDMPPNKPKLSDEDIKTVADWINAGAVMPVPVH